MQRVLNRRWTDRLQSALLVGVSLCGGGSLLGRELGVLLPDPSPLRVLLLLRVSGPPALHGLGSECEV